MYKTSLVQPLRTETFRCILVIILLFILLNAIQHCYSSGVSLKFSSKTISSQFSVSICHVAKQVSSVTSLFHRLCADVGNTNSSQSQQEPVEIIQKLDKPVLTGLKPVFPSLKPVKILDWTGFFGAHLNNSFMSQCPAHVRDLCHVTSDRALAANSDVLLFHNNVNDLNPVKTGFQTRFFINQNPGMITSFQNRYLLPYNRQPWQRYVFLTLEPPTRRFMNTGFPENFFNWTMTISRQSDIWWPYGQFEPLSQSKGSVQPSLDLLRSVEQSFAKKRKFAAWMASHCKTHGKRENYIRELQKHTPIDIYGKCGNLSCEHSDSDKCRTMVETEYKFYLAFENSVCREYVSEKFWRFAKKMIILVVLSKRVMENIGAPPHSYIAADEFKSAKELAEYLKRVLGRRDPLTLNRSAYSAVRVPGAFERCQWYHKSKYDPRKSRVSESTPFDVGSSGGSSPLDKSSVNFYAQRVHLGKDAPSFFKTSQDRSHILAYQGSICDNRLTMDKLDKALEHLNAEPMNHNDVIRLFQFARDTRVFPNGTADAAQVQSSSTERKARVRSKKFARRATWLYPQDSCFIRAEMVCRLAKEVMPLHPRHLHKIFVFGDLVVLTNFSSSGYVEWWYHVVALVRDSSLGYVVLDAALDREKPLPVRDWLKLMQPSGHVTQLDGFALTNRFGYIPQDNGDEIVSAYDEWEALADPSSFTSVTEDLLDYLDEEWANIVSLGMDPGKLL